MRTVMMICVLALIATCYYPSVLVVAVRSGQPELSVPIYMADTADLYLNLSAQEIVTADPDRQLITYPIAIGKIDTPTPQGEFYVANRIYRPMWWPKNKPAVPPGEDNPLGEWWLGLNLPGYGIHGTNAPKSIGTMASLGCIRMFNEHVTELAEQVSVGAKVVIGSRDVELRREPGSGRIWLYVWRHPYQSTVEVRTHTVRAALAVAGLICAEETVAYVQDSIACCPPVFGQPAVFALYAPGKVRSTVINTAWVTDSEILIPLRMAAEALDLGVQYNPITKLAVVNNRPVQGPITDWTMFVSLQQFVYLVGNDLAITGSGWLIQ